MKKTMITIMLAASLFTANALAEESTVYLGLDVVGSDNTFTQKLGAVSLDVDDDSKGYKLKFGASLSEGWRVQAYYQRETYDIPVYDNTHDVLNEIGADVIKGFEVTPEFNPFLQAGMGLGWMKVNGYADNTANTLSLKLGAGLMYKFTPVFEGIAGIDLQYRDWEDVETFLGTIELSETSSRFYIGANFHF